jgi:hypothetical protein
MIRRQPRGREFAYNAHRDQLAVDGVVLPGQTIDALRDAPDGAVVRVLQRADRTTHLIPIDPDGAPSVAHSCRQLADAIDAEGGDHLAARALREACEQIDVLREALATVVRARNDHDNTAAARLHALEAEAYGTVTDDAPKDVPE